MIKLSKIFVMKEAPLSTPKSKKEMPTREWIDTNGNQGHKLEIIELGTGEFSIGLYMAGVSSTEPALIEEAGTLDEAIELAAEFLDRYFSWDYGDSFNIMLDTVREGLNTGVLEKYKR